MPNKMHCLGYFSSYDRGLHHLLRMWPKIKEKYPDATLYVCYGWGTFEQRYANNPERMAWKQSMDKLMEQDGITHYGRVGHGELDKITMECGIWAYPTDFDEINCITALNCQRLGCVPCVINKAALKETVGSGVKVEGDIFDPEVYEAYLEALLDLMGDEKRWKEEQVKGVEFVKDYAWANIAKQWTKVFGEL